MLYSEDFDISCGMPASAAEHTSIADVLLLLKVRVVLIVLLPSAVILTMSTAQSMTTEACQLAHPSGATPLPEGEPCV